MRSKSLSLIAAAGAVLLATAATAAPASAPAGGDAKAAGPIAGNPKAPVDITSDHAVAYNNDCIAVWTGNAEALQNDARLKADVMTAYLEKNPSSKAGASGGSGACGDLLRLEATGSVYYVTPQQKVHGDKAIYVAADDTVTVIGDVVAVRGQNVLRGDRMVFNNKTGEGHMEGNATGRNKADRPRGVFYPKQSESLGAKGAKSASAAKGGKAPKAGKAAGGSAPVAEASPTTTTSAAAAAIPATEPADR